MMKRLIKLINKNNSGRIVLGLFILTNIVYLLMLTITIPNTMIFSNGLKILDMMPLGYDLNYVHDLFSALGNNGRAYYLNKQLALDMIYPMLFALSYSLILLYFLKKLNKLNTSLKYLSLLPGIAGFADYLENLGIILMLKGYPDLTDVVVKSTNFCSLTKSLSTTLTFIVLIIMLIILSIKFTNNVTNSK